MLAPGGLRVTAQTAKLGASKSQFIFSGGLPSTCLNSLHRPLDRGLTSLKTPYHLVLRCSNNNPLPTIFAEGMRGTQILSVGLGIALALVAARQNNKEVERIEGKRRRRWWSIVMEVGVVVCVWRYVW